MFLFEVLFYKNKKLKLIFNRKEIKFSLLIFILMILVTISFGFKSGFDRYIGTRWEIMLKIIDLAIHAKLLYLYKFNVFIDVKK